MELQSISFIGTGNVAANLALIFRERGINIAQVVSGDFRNAELFANRFECEALENVLELKAVALLIVCTPDHLVNSIVKQLDKNQLVVYTAGSVSLESIDHPRLGVFYPLQTFTKDRPPNWQELPILIEAKSPRDQDYLVEIAEKISTVVRVVNSDSRKKLHLVAVWTNNFVNFILGNAQELSNNLEVDFALVQPLLKETLLKLETSHGFDVQTGPARRGDLSTIKEHLSLMNEEQGELYLAITKHILEHFNQNEEL